LGLPPRTGGRLIKTAKKMKSFIRNLSAPAEFCIVILLCFGVPLSSSVLVIVRHLMHVAQAQAHFNNGTVLRILTWQLVPFAVVLCLGRIRGWSLATLGFRVSWKSTGAGVLLYVAATVTAVLVHLYAAAHAFRPETHRLAMVTTGLTLPFILLNSMTNPLFEETFEAGYVIRSLQGFGMWPAILAGAVLRAALHAYLGSSVVVAVFATGVIFGLVYWRWRQLWPPAEGGVAESLDFGMQKNQACQIYRQPGGRRHWARKQNPL
jgi:membrane protease YdiL (CAAX protease family)